VIPTVSAVSVVKVGVLFASAIGSAGLGTGIFVAQIMVGDQSVVAEVVAGSSFAFGFWLIRWTWKVLNEWKKIADSDRVACAEREANLRQDLEVAWANIADLHKQLSEWRHKHDNEMALRISLEAAGVVDRRRNDGPIEGTPV